VDPIEIRQQIVLSLFALKGETYTRMGNALSREGLPATCGISMQGIVSYQERLEDRFTISISISAQPTSNAKPISYRNQVVFTI
jgi:hypothetical protein